MHKSATKCNKIVGKWWKNKHGASKIIDTFETYQTPKLWAIFHENGHKRKNDEFFVIPVSNIQTIIFLVNVHRTPKQ
jgi:hypothetical protein